MPPQERLADQLMARRAVRGTPALEDTSSLHGPSNRLELYKAFEATAQQACSRADASPLARWARSHEGEAPLARPVKLSDVANKSSRRLVDAESSASASGDTENRNNWRGAGW